MKNTVIIFEFILEDVEYYAELIITKQVCSNVLLYKKRNDFFMEDINYEIRLYIQEFFHLTKGINMTSKRFFEYIKLCKHIENFKNHGLNIINNEKNSNTKLRHIEIRRRILEYIYSEKDHDLMELLKYDHISSAYSNALQSGF